ncbi:DUF58 domain-containing protein [Roseibacillus ishigakijimensis]|uniref:DUF58 domain-containing protein n=1 Tax=Roseibacillus ishigakijimensis TaxID=454146 RepID=A0A934VGP2_9BACT|nr:DUF58 domain-containing protein [Roseibacillus ishigakijimensis]MBK1833073.1 DUF58 domain-containing protein [Roseibacillus ishigakijimensis]
MSWLDKYIPPPLPKGPSLGPPPLPSQRSGSLARAKAAAAGSDSGQNLAESLQRAQEVERDLQEKARLAREQADLAHARQLLDEDELNRFKNLLVFAKSAVESRFAGKHKSRDLGSGGEFAEHRQYQPGLQTSAIDWQVYARTKRLFVRTYEELTDLAVHLVVDASGSMVYHSKGKESKSLRAARIAAALACLMMRQGDKVGLTLFGDRVLSHLPTSGTERHLQEMLRTFIKPALQPSGPTSIANSLRESALLLKRRGRLVVLSDFLGEDPADILDALGPFVHRRFDILLLQLSDPDERTLPDAPLARFVDAETNEQMEVEPAELRAAFEETVARRTRDLREGARQQGIDFAILDTARPYLDAIEAYLGFRHWNDLTPTPPR